MERNRHLYYLYEHPSHPNLSDRIAPNYYDLDAVPLERITIPKMPDCDGAIYVMGDNMVPVLRPGDIVCYKTLSDHVGVCYGEMYLLVYVMEGKKCVSVKYVHRSEVPEHYRLESHNPRCRPRDIPVESVHAMARVKVCINIHSID